MRSYYNESEVAVLLGVPLRWLKQLRADRVLEPTNSNRDGWMEYTAGDATLAYVARALARNGCPWVVLQSAVRDVKRQLLVSAEPYARLVICINFIPPRVLDVQVAPWQSLRRSSLWDLPTAPRSVTLCLGPFLKRFERYEQGRPRQQAARFSKWIWEAFGGAAA